MLNVFTTYIHSVYYTHTLSAATALVDSAVRVHTDPRRKGGEGGGRICRFEEKYFF